MHQRIRAKFSFANVISVIALFIALSGAAYAGGLITGKDIKKHSITGENLAKNTIRGKNIKESTLKGSDQCPGGAPNAVSDLCFSSPRVANTWDAAARNCPTAGLRLPDVPELLLISTVAQITPPPSKPANTPYSWSSTPADPGKHVGVRSITEPVLAPAADATLLTYRCVVYAKN